MKHIGYDYTINYRAGKHNTVPNVVYRQLDLQAIIHTESLSQDTKALKITHQLQQGKYKSQKHGGGGS